MIIEGPVVTIVAAMLASLGAFNWIFILLFSMAGDVIGDVILYGLGYKYGMGFVRGFGKYMGITEPLVLRMEKYFNSHGGKTIFAVKSTTGLCWATFTAAGIVKMDFGKFVKRISLEGNQPIHRLDRLGCRGSRRYFLCRHNIVQEEGVKGTAGCEWEVGFPVARKPPNGGGFFSCLNPGKIIG
ncbi:MAG: hypothetical protein UX75_C0024G0001 [Candidatus Moranbacteria bacterium GW2011_GWE2_47_10]|nr:MAG: hypothetical protein UX75_C0024G0001 [Candidatus Moranbacteria bacterium GW2011_GWE2_47_10]